MNGNRWVGTGHNAVFRDFDGQWWTVFHAVDRFDPYFRGTSDFTRRPALLDPLDWVHGWPRVRAGRWASDRPMPSPAAQPGQHTRYHPVQPVNQEPGRRIPRLSDEFSGPEIDSRWTWIREPGDGHSVGNGHFRFHTQSADLTGEGGDASILTEPAPHRDYVVETRVKLEVPSSGCCHNYNQVGLLIHRDDDRFIKLVHVSIWETRQTEFAKETVLGDGAAHYGNTVVGAPAEWTYLRIARRTVERPQGVAREFYTGYTSQDGRTWVRGGTWTHRLGDDARIGLVSMGAEDPADTFPAAVDYVRVSRLQLS
jgi:arabinan endo-1,5-alpha-L-arabinosidase